MADTKADSQDIAEQIRQLRDDLAALSDTVRSFGRSQAEAGVEALRDAANRAGESVRLSADEARRRGERAAEDLGAQISENPISAVLIAAGVGFFIGALMGRR